MVGFGLCGCSTQIIPPYSVNKQKTPCRFEPYTVWKIDPEDYGRNAIRVDYPLAIWTEKGYTTSAVRA